MSVETVRLDQAVIRVYELARSIASGTISALIVGETGCGKECLAETIHRDSRRADKSFLRLNCAALSETLLESELFGHERGAFTGATQSKPGLLETADGGTVFLDELGEMPLTLQAKLLRVIEERRVTRVGGLRSFPIDIRVISATNRNLETEISRGTFRKDLYYRLNGVQLTLPPLRDRKSEVEPLARLFLSRAAREAGREQPPALSPEAVDWMLRYAWPGNIRELRNVMERAALVVGQREIVTLADLPESSAQSPSSPSSSSQPRGLSSSELDTVVGGIRTAFPIDACGDERARVIGALESCVWNQTRAAKLLKMSRSTLVSRIAEYGLPRPRKQPQ
jgi:transcriptional regulator with PAS, ATPase and Fis domain